MAWYVMNEEPYAHIKIYFVVGIDYVKSILSIDDPVLLKAEEDLCFLFEEQEYSEASSFCR